jgi:hypothetical protein
MAAITLVSLVFLPETHRRDINDVHDADPETTPATTDLAGSAAR